jgi:predicted Fe-Mo cluster-binding NifX family protein
MRPVKGTDMPYRIALTSSDGNRIDLHFGHTDLFHILQVNEETGVWKALEWRSLPEEIREDAGPDHGGGGGCSGHHDERLNRVISLLSDCRYLLTFRIGKKPHAFLQRAGITALESPPDISTAVSKLNAYHLKYGNVNKEK